MGRPLLYVRLIWSDVLREGYIEYQGPEDAHVLRTSMDSKVQSEALVEAAEFLDVPVAFIHTRPMPQDEVNEVLAYRALEIDPEDYDAKAP